MTWLTISVKTEAVKVVTSKPLWLLPVVTVLLTWVLTYVTGLSDLKATGGDLGGTTAENNPLMYADKLPPLEFQGFDLMNIGLILMIALGAIYAGAEYRDGLIRSSLIAQPRRVRLFVTKAGVLVAIIAVTAALSMGVGTVLRHLALGEHGLDPLAFPPLVWRNVAGVALTWSVLGLLAFTIGVIARNAIVPLVFTIPLAVGLGDFLVTLWEPAKFLPPAAGADLFTPADGIHLDPVTGALVMSAWAAISIVSAGALFLKRDA
ncbi:ABC transporter permease [Cryobacterium sp. SO2]|uniref:ABC transporter permease n=1 Tax=Cryobacterium sp. SO2 TaxID=1897060 RepID=UPI00223E8E23|nr:ABC transporter permease [Cryobacterium sp. SO2]WEO78736.1 ABC transporter permease [Cryobacterium sp. SO2]